MIFFPSPLRATQLFSILGAPDTWVFVASLFAIVGHRAAPDIIDWADNLLTLCKLGSKKGSRFVNIDRFGTFFDGFGIALALDSTRGYRLITNLRS